MPANEHFVFNVGAHPSAPLSLPRAIRVCLLCWVLLRVIRLCLLCWVLPTGIRLCLLFRTTIAVVLWCKGLLYSCFCVSLSLIVSEHYLLMNSSYCTFLSCMFWKCLWQLWLHHHKFFLSLGITGLVSHTCVYFVLVLEGCFWCYFMHFFSRIIFCFPKRHLAVSLSPIIYFKIDPNFKEQTSWD